MASGRIILPITEPILNSSGQPVSGATLTIDIAGGATLANVYADSGLVTPVTNPQASDAAGRFYSQSTVLWCDSSQAYDCTVNWPDGTSETYKNIFVLGAAANISGLAPLNSPAFTGVPTAPTTALNDNSNSLATTGYVQGQNYAPLNSPALTGVPTTPTAAANTNTTQIASTAFVGTALGLTSPTNATSGYMKFLGVTLQWTPFSLGAPGGSTQAVSWPIAFSSGLLGIPWVSVNNAALEMIGVSAVSNSGATINKGSTDGFARTGVVFALGI
jgi:hypothetical protein